MPAAVPLWVGDVELAGPLTDVRPPPRPDGSPYQRARLLARLHGEPVGFLEIDLKDGALVATALVEAVESRLGDTVSEHLRQDGIGDGRLALGGLPSPSQPSCAAPGPCVGDQPAVSVAVCTRQRPTSLRRTLVSLLMLESPVLEVLVVDNAPAGDATWRVVQELADTRLRYVCEPRAGLSCARNRAVREFEGDLLAFTDDDVVVDGRWLGSLARGFTRAPGVGCVTGLVSAATLETQAELFFDARMGWSDSCTQRLYDLDDHRPDHPLYPYSGGAFGTGASFAVSRACLQLVRGFDEALGAGSPAQAGEDLDFFLRTLLAGMSISYEPAAIAWHFHRHDDDELRRQIAGYSVGLGAYVFKHMTDRRLAWDVLSRLPRGIATFARFTHAADVAVAPPPGVVRAQLAGLLCGPAAYRRGRRRLG